MGVVAVEGAAASDKGRAYTSMIRMPTLRRRDVAYLNHRRHHGRRERLAAIKFLAGMIKRGSSAAPTSPA